MKTKMQASYGIYKKYYFLRCTYLCLTYGCFRCTTTDMHLIFKALNIAIKIIINNNNNNQKMRQSIMM